MTARRDFQALSEIPIYVQVLVYSAFSAPFPPRTPRWDFPIVQFPTAHFLHRFNWASSRIESPTIPPLQACFMRHKKCTQHDERA